MGECGVCYKCGWGHKPEDFAMLGFPTKEEYMNSCFANRIRVGDDLYCPDCARINNIKKERD